MLTTRTALHETGKLRRVTHTFTPNPGLYLGITTDCLIVNDLPILQSESGSCPVLGHVSHL